MERPALELVEEMTITLEKLKRAYRRIYEGLFSSPFISIKRLSEALGMD